MRKGSKHFKKKVVDYTVYNKFFKRSIARFSTDFLLF